MNRGQGPPGRVRPPVDESGGREDERLAGGKSVAKIPQAPDTTREPRWCRHTDTWCWCALEHLEQARAAEEREYAELVEQAAATGKLPSVNGWGRWVYDSPSSKLVVAGVSVCHQNAATAGRSAGPALFAALKGRVAAVVEQSAKLAATVPPGVVDETSALHAGDGDTKHHTTWRKLRAAVDTWTRCFELLAVTQRAGWVDGPTHPRDCDGAVIFQRYARPYSLPPGYGRVPASCGWRRPRRPTQRPACTAGRTR